MGGTDLGTLVMVSVTISTSLLWIDVTHAILNFSPSPVSGDSFIYIKKD